jgi:hypothetical protein
MNNNKYITTIACIYYSPTHKYYYRKTISEARLKQEKWRQKQIKTLYSEGRPIFGQYKQNFQ